MNEPKLRFPEFKGEWEEKKLGEECEITAGGDIPKEKISKEKTEIYKVPIISNGIGNNAIYGYTDSPKITQAAITISARGTIGYAEYREYPYYPIVRLLSVFPKDSTSLNTKYLAYILSIQKYDVTNAGIPQLTVPMIGSVIFHIPPSPAEQDKIASCLSAMDDLIAAQAEKVEALKEKKTGLMQQLFPQPGETTPRLRFPKFSGEWEEKKLGELLTYEQPTPYLVTDTNYKKSGIPVLTAGKTFILGYTDETHGVYDNLPVIIFDDFVTESKFVDFPFKVKSSAMKMLKLLDENNNLHLIYELMQLLQYPVKEHKRYWISEYSRLTIPLPPSPAEQEKIASCLSALDDQIAAETEKLTALKDYKKGLMQQLFPQPAK